jgi:hypothetical protein
MRRIAMYWAPGVLLAVALLVAGCTDREERRSQAPGEGVAQAPRDQGMPVTPPPSAPQERPASPEPTQPDTAREKSDQQQKP